MMSEPLVSIIVPVYNVAGYVLKCLESLWGQSYKNIEIVVVDDGSTDTSGEICDEFAKNKKTVRVFHQNNQGLSAARNFGILEAKGELIALVDSDDFVAKDFVEKMVEVLKKNNADIVECGFNGEKPAEEVLNGREAAVKLLVGQENLDVVAWNKIYKKELFVDNKIWYPVGEKHEDSLTTYKLLSFAKKVAYIPNSLYFYVERKNSIMDKVRILERLEMRERAARESIEFFANDDDLQEAAKISLLTAKLALVDAGIKGLVSKKVLDANINWVSKHSLEYKNNNYLTKKLKLYLQLIKIFGGKGYIIFRKIKH